jgi:hypothetical protein
MSKAAAKYESFRQENSLKKLRETSKGTSGVIHHTTPPTQSMSGSLLLLLIAAVAHVDTSGWYLPPLDAASCCCCCHIRVCVVPAAAHRAVQCHNVTSKATPSHHCLATYLWCSVVETTRPLFVSRRVLGTIVCLLTARIA